MKKSVYKLDELNELPNSPGIYFMKDEGDFVIYVGKSKNLKNRVKSYFFKGGGHSRKIKRMIKNVSHVDIIRTDTEFDALLLECRYIHEIKPMYNTLLKNYDKYKYLSLNQKSHNLIEVKDDIDDHGIYFGPYSFGRKMTAIKDILVKVYKLPICSRPNKCIRYDLGKCIAPCRGNVNETLKYSTIKNIESDLNGKSHFVVRQLKKEMNSQIENLNFEKAAVIKEEIDLFSSIVRKQKNLLNLKRNIVFWMKMDEFKYKIYYISMFEVKYEKILDTKNLSRETVDKIKREIKELILKEGKSDRIIKKEEIDYINIVNEYIKNTEDRGYIIV
ncbi:MAG: GIY-YIG nuclease family protein [Intestinibacter sp.]|uniref:GIY-YIG nuclease family protein n=1 Tax=Intestinibacter sp. TaxID=1965304 RepID=UPI002A828F23|nr:GIY-YIG nuclease family protein [Intestinibacter sp.]MDY4575739.1 GIY-YIG nuclease family protein [Intestinibacter sp.]